MIIELWMTDIHDQTSKLVSTETVLFSLSKNQDELNDLNKLIEYLVQLQNIEKREKEVTELLKQGRKQEALKAKTSLTDETYSLFSSFSSFIPKDDDEAATTAYLKLKSNTMYRRSKDFESFSMADGVTDEELMLHSSSSSRLNSKYRKMYEDL